MVRIERRIRRRDGHGPQTSHLTPPTYLKRVSSAMPGERDWQVDCLGLVRIPLHRQAAIRFPASSARVTIRGEGRDASPVSAARDKWPVTRTDRVMRCLLGAEAYERTDIQGDGQ